MVVIADLLDAILRAATPLLLAGLGELINQRAGNLNLGVEGTMLVGALIGFATTVVFGNPYLGFTMAILVGMMMASIHAFLTVSLKSDQVISGIMLTLLGIGLTAYFGGPWTGESIAGFGEFTIPLIGDTLVSIPVLGTVLFENTFPEYLALILTPIVWYLLFRTNFGLQILAVGESPGAADTMGVSVTRTRYITIIISGAFSGAAGAALSLATLSLWVEGLVAGRGWIVIALIVFAQWRPIGVFAGALFFGSIDMLRLRTPELSGLYNIAPPLSGVFDFMFDPSVMSAYPYIATVLVLVIVSINVKSEWVRAPDAFLQPYYREDG